MTLWHQNATDISSKVANLQNPCVLITGVKANDYMGTIHNPNNLSIKSVWRLYILLLIALMVLQLNTNKKLCSYQNYRLVFLGVILVLA